MLSCDSATVIVTYSLDDLYLLLGTSLAVIRLRAKGISISDTTRINAAGHVSYVCFDKTGTLTGWLFFISLLSLIKIVSSQSIARVA
jgi:cation transport ATPase